MGGNIGVAATIDALDFLISAGLIGRDMLADGKINVWELLKLGPLVPKVLKVGGELSQIPAELGEMDQDDAAKLIAYVSSRLPQITDNMRLQAIVNAYLKVIVDLAQAIAMTVAPVHAEVPVAAV